MKSFSELNTYAQSEISHTDDRGYGVIFDRNTGTDYDLDPEITDSFALPLGIEILEVINYESADCKMKVDVSSLIGTTVTWSAPPAHSTTTVVQGVYTIDGIRSRANWNSVKQPTITLPAGYNGDEFEVVVTIEYQQDIGDSSVGTYTKTYTVFANAVTAFLNPSISLTCDPTAILEGQVTITGAFSPNIEVNIIPVDTWNDPATIPFDYNPSTSLGTQMNTAAPQLNTISGDAVITYTVTVTTNRPEILALISMAGGGAAVSFAYDSGTKTATFTGDRDEINTYIPFLKIHVSDSPIKYFWDFELNFNLTNDINSNSEDYVVTAISDNETILGEDTPDTYTLNTATTITGGPDIDPLSIEPAEIHSLTITPYDATQVASLEADIVVGTGISAATRILHNEINKAVGHRIAMSEDGTRIFAGSTLEHRIYIRSGSSWSQEQTFDEADFGSTTAWSAQAIDMAEDASRIIWWGYIGTSTVHTEQKLYIYSRSGSSWSEEQVITNSSPDYDNRIVAVRINEDGSKFTYVTADGEIGFWTRSGSTWTESSKLTGQFTRTFTGNSTWNLVYDYLNMDVSGDGNYVTIGLAIDFGASDTPPIPSDPDYSLIDEWSDRILIYASEAYQDTRTISNPAAVAMDYDGNRLFVNNRVYARTLANWSLVDTLDFNTDSGLIFDVAPYQIACSSDGTKVAYTARQQTTNYPWVLTYLNPLTGNWGYQAKASNTSQQVILNGIDESLGCAMSSDGVYFGYGNPDYTISTNNKGEVNVYTIVNYGIETTDTKELTATGTPSQINSVLTTGFTMTPATDEEDTIELIYEVTCPSSTNPYYDSAVGSRNHTITRTP